jgi:hypothetical protein
MLLPPDEAAGSGVPDIVPRRASRLGLPDGTSPPNPAHVIGRSQLQ